MNRIRLLREEKGIGQNVLAQLLGLEVSAISKLEKCRVPLKDEYIIKLATYFDVSTDYLLGKSSIRNNDIHKDNTFVAIYEDYKELADEDKAVINATIKALKKKKK